MEFDHTLGCLGKDWTSIMEFDRTLGCLGKDWTSMVWSLIMDFLGRGNCMVVLYPECKAAAAG